MGKGMSFKAHRFNGFNGLRNPAPVDMVYLPLLGFIHLRWLAGFRPPRNISGWVYTLVGGNTLTIAMRTFWSDLELDRLFKTGDDDDKLRKERFSGKNIGQKMIMGFGMCQWNI